MINSKFRNIKNGNVYIVLNQGIDCTNERDGTEVIVYYPEDKKDFLCVREKKEFLVKFIEIK